jgi:hypothetical protein
METSKVEVKKIIEQEVKPNESLIVWSDMYMRYLKKTYTEQVTDLNVNPEVAKQRLLDYITERIQNEIRT